MFDATALIIIVSLAIVALLAANDKVERTRNAVFISTNITDLQGRRGYRDTYPSPYYMPVTPDPWPTVNNVSHNDRREEFPYLYGNDPFVYDGPLPYNYDPYYDLRYPALHLRTINPRAFIDSEAWPSRVPSDTLNPVTAEPYTPTMSVPPNAFLHSGSLPISGFNVNQHSKEADLMRWMYPVPCSDPDFHGQLPCDVANCTVGAGPSYAM